jgi:hypothetical protein
LRDRDISYLGSGVIGQRRRRRAIFSSAIAILPAVVATGRLARMAAKGLETCDSILARAMAKRMIQAREQEERAQRCQENVIRLCIF